MTIAIRDALDEDTPLLVAVNTKANGGGGPVADDASQRVALRGLPLSETNENNLHKTIVLFKWFRALQSIRRRVLADHTRRPRGNVDHHSSRRGPFRYVSSVHLLDLGKLQLLEVPQGERRHLSCRYTPVRSTERFRRSLGRRPLSLVLNTPFDEGILLLPPSSWTAGRRQTTFWSVTDLIQAFTSLVETDADFVDALWSIDGMKDGLLDPNGRSHIFFLHNRKEFGAIFHDDGARCRDDGNAILIQALAHQLLGHTYS